MRSSRVLALSLALIISVFLAACGGGGGKNTTPTQPLTVISTVLPQATVNVPYNFIFQASGGSGTYTWAITKGTLPKGITFDGQTAVLGGTTTQPGTFNFTIQVTDTPGDTASQAVALNVSGAIGITCNSCFAGTTTLPAGTPGSPYMATFTAVGGIAPYTWSITSGTLPAGLSINASTGTISGTPTTPQAPTTFTIQADDSEVPQSIGTAQITISVFGVSTTSLSSGEIYVAYSQQMMLAGGASPYSWCVMESNGSCDNGSGGALPAGITLAPTCTSTRQTTCAIGGTPTVSGTFNFTVQVTDSETPPAVTTGALSLSIAGIGNGALSGPYVFDFTGYNNGSPVFMAGAFTADGNGNITGGELDFNDGSGEPASGCSGGPQQQLIMAAPSSTYSIGTTGAGLGKLTLVTSAGTYNFTIAIRQDGSGNLIQDNTDPATRGSGTIKVQTPNIGTGQLQANFAVGAHGSDPSGNRYVAAGQLSMENGQGDFTGPAFDADEGGTASQHTFAGTLSTTIDPFGRGCFADMTFDGNPHKLPPYVFAYYIVSQNEVDLVSTNPLGGTNNANLARWSLERQIVGATGFNNSNLATTNVVELQGRDTSGASDVTTGFFTGTGSSSHTCQSGDFDTATFNYDENAGGTLNQGQKVAGQYCIDKNTGRVTLQKFDGIWASTPPVFYLAGNDPGSVVGTDTANSAGTVETQNGSAFTNSAVGGGYWGGTIAPTISAATDSVASLFADGGGNIIGTQFTSAPSGPAGPTNFNWTYNVDTTGHSVVQKGGKTVGILYVVSPTGSIQFQSKFIFLPAGDDPVLNVFLGTKH